MTVIAWDGNLPVLDKQVNREDAKYPGISKGKLQSTGRRNRAGMGRLYNRCRVDIGRYKTWKK